MQIGKINIKPAIILAPMAGVTDEVFRRLVKDLGGCGLVYSEMVSDQALVHGNQKTREMLTIFPEERPVTVQIFGSNPQTMAQAAKIVEENGADIIDINMGCPVPKVVKNSEGSALLRNIPLAAEIIKAVVAAVNVPVTVKTRVGWCRDELSVFELLKAAEDSGASAIAVHGRTREQYYSGKADWDIIARVKQMAKIPVIGNGDVFTPEDAKQLFEHTGCDAIMVGRGCLGNPWLFKQIDYFLSTGEKMALPTMEEIKEVIIRHLRELIKLNGEYVGVREMRKHISWYIKGLPGAARERAIINQLDNAEHLEAELQKYFAFLTDNNKGN